MCFGLPLLNLMKKCFSMLVINRLDGLPLQLSAKILIGNPRGTNKMKKTKSKQKALSTQANTFGTMMIANAKVWEFPIAIEMLTFGVVVGK